MSYQDNGHYRRAPGQTQTTVSLPEDLLEASQQFAQECGLSRSGLIRQALKLITEGKLTGTIGFNLGSPKAEAPPAPSEDISIEQTDQIDLRLSDDGEPMATSLQIARSFEKRHDNVIRDIRELLEDEEVRGRLNFEQSSYTNSQNKRQPMYLMNRDGFVLLAMGFNGKRALRFKLRYIDAFNEMERKLSSLRTQSESVIPAFQEGMLNLVTGISDVVSKMADQLNQHAALLASLMSHKETPRDEAASLTEADQFPKEDVAIDKGLYIDDIGEPIYSVAEVAKLPGMPNKKELYSLLRAEGYLNRVANRNEPSPFYIPHYFLRLRVRVKNQYYNSYGWTYRITEQGKDRFVELFHKETGKLAKKTP